VSAQRLARKRCRGAYAPHAGAARLGTHGRFIKLLLVIIVFNSVQRASGVNVKTYRELSESQGLQDDFGGHHGLLEMLSSLLNCNGHLVHVQHCGKSLLLLCTGGDTHTWCPTRAAATALFFR
jgi:hypothetical protein